MDNLPTRITRILTDAIPGIDPDTAHTAATHLIATLNLRDEYGIVADGGYVVGITEDTTTWDLVDPDLTARVVRRIITDWMGHTAADDVVAAANRR